MTDRTWCSLTVSSDELNIDLTLGSGQAFLWRRDPCTGSWCGPIGNRLYCLVRECPDTLSYWSYPPASDPTEDQAVLTEYFRLDLSLSSLYSSWSMRDENFSVKSLSCRGIRLLSQHPLETLIAFICSSNNNIERIQLMMRNLARELGEHICDHGGVAYHSFPSLSKLSGSGVEDVLTRIGFGYRAKYVYQTALKLERELGGEDWLSELKRKSYEDAWQSLQDFPGVGRKVADCVCLAGLGHMTAVPVDIHILRVAVRDYSSQLPSSLANVKSLSASNYKIIGDHFRRVFGDKAGWAQAILFASELNRSHKLEPSNDQSLSTEHRKSHKRK